MDGEDVGTHIMGLSAFHDLNFYVGVDEVVEMASRKGWFSVDEVVDISHHQIWTLKTYVYVSWEELGYGLPEAWRMKFG